MTLDRTFTLNFVNVLIWVPITETFAGRSSLLFGLPPSIEIELKRNQEVRRLDLDLIVNQLNMPGYIDVKPLLIVAQNACSHTSGRTDLLSTLNGTLQELERYYEQSAEEPLLPPPIEPPKPIREVVASSPPLSLQPPQPQPDLRKMLREPPNPLPLDELAGQSSNTPNSSPPRPKVPRPVGSRLAIDEKKYRAASKMTPEAQINQLYACYEIVYLKGWSITPEKDKINEGLYVNIGNDYKIHIKWFYNTHPVIRVIWRIETLPQLGINEIVIPLLNEGANLYRLVKAIANDIPKIDRIRKNNDNIQA